MCPIQSIGSGWNKSDMRKIWPHLWSKHSCITGYQSLVMDGAGCSVSKTMSFRIFVRNFSPPSIFAEEMISIIRESLPFVLTGNTAIATWWSLLGGWAFMTNNWSIQEILVLSWSIVTRHFWRVLWVPHGGIQLLTKSIFPNPHKKKVLDHLPTG